MVTRERVGELIRLKRPVPLTYILVSSPWLGRGRVVVMVGYDRSPSLCEFE